MFVASVECLADGTSNVFYITESMTACRDLYVRCAVGRTADE